MADKRHLVASAAWSPWIIQAYLTTDLLGHLREPSAEEGAGACESLHRDLDYATRTAVLIEEYLQPAENFWMVSSKCARTVESLFLTGPMGRQNRALGIRIDCF